MVHLIALLLLHHELTVIVIIFVHGSKSHFEQNSALWVSLTYLCSVNWGHWFCTELVAGPTQATRNCSPVQVFHTHPRGLFPHDQLRLRHSTKGSATG